MEADAIERLMEEHKDLYERTDYLHKFFLSDTYETLSNVEVNLLEEQYTHMTAYMSILESRISLYTDFVNISAQDNENEPQ